MTTTDGVVVRPAEAGDAVAMAEVHVAAWQTGYAGVLPQEFLDGLAVERSAGAWRADLSGEQPSGSTALMAEVDGRVVGITSFGPYRSLDGEPPALDLCELWMLNVHPEVWGTGVAQTLMAAALDGLRAERPEPQAVLWVLEGNGRGRRFYEKEGWVADGAEKPDTFAGRDVVELRYRHLL